MAAGPVSLQHHRDLSKRWLGQAVSSAGSQVTLLALPLTGVLHDVLVDLGQLWEYHRRPLGHQPFYAFPWPDWRGNLHAAANAEGRPVTELGFARSGSGWWFADWMVPLIRVPARMISVEGRYARLDVAELLRGTAHVPAVHQLEEQLVTLEPAADGHYAIARASVDDRSGSPDDDQTGSTRNEPQGDGDNRQIVFLQAQSLFRA
jgi:hypothetical protein